MSYLGRYDTLVGLLDGDTSCLYTTTNMSCYNECNKNMRWHYVSVGDLMLVVSLVTGVVIVVVV